MIKLTDILFEGKLSKSEIKKMKDNFDKTGKLPPHLQKLADLMKKNTKVKDIVVPGLEWMAEEKLTERTDDKIRVQGIGVYTYKTLKKDVEKKLKDLTRRNKQGAHYGIAKTNFNVLSAMWLALQDYEKK